MAQSGNVANGPLPEGVFSLLDTDLYKLTMQCAVLKYFPDKLVTYHLSNRTPDHQLTRRAFDWLHEQVRKLGNIALSAKELEYLRTQCSYLNEEYLKFLSTFRLRPDEQIEMKFVPVNNTNSPDDVGDIDLNAKGLWVDTILYEIPLLALTSEAYFKFCDKDWAYDGQEEKAYNKALRLIEHGCNFSEFGTRRRRDYHTQDLVMTGLCRAHDECVRNKKSMTQGSLSGTSNVHFAMKYDVAPIGTVAHEWFMGIAAITNDYENANEKSLRYWLGCFGEGVLGIALTDTFGTTDFLRAFKKPISAENSTSEKSNGTHSKPKTYAQVFGGVRQDSGDPLNFIQMMKAFYESENIKEKKTIVFSDSLNIDTALEYKEAAEQAGFIASFGIGTFLTNDFQRLSDHKKSVPLNIVIKVSSAGGRPAIKISDNIGKNTGDNATVKEVKKRLGYVEREWEGGDEAHRWDV